MWVISTLLGYYRLAVDATKELLIRILMGILIFLGYVLLSLFIYAVMRRIMVPQKLHVLPVHLHYDSKCLIQPSGRDLSECRFPQAGLVLNNGKKLLRSGQYYSVMLEMEAPENQVNLDAGVFMVNLTFYSKKMQYLATSARPATVHYKSSLLQVMQSIFYALPLLLGFLEQKQTLELVLFENYYEPYGDGTISAMVSLESHRVHIYSTRLVVTADFSGFTYYLYQWPISMSIIVVISVLITLCTCTVLLWVRDVIHDYEERHAIGMQRRRDMFPPPRGGGRSGVRGVVRPPPMEHRRQVQQPPPPPPDNREAETVGMASGRGGASGGGSGMLVLAAAPPAGGQRPAFERPGGRLDENSSVDMVIPTDTTPTDTRESSIYPGDTESEAGCSGNNTGGNGGADGLGEVIQTLQSLRQEMDSSDMSIGSDMESKSSQGEFGLRRRTGN